MAGGYGNIRPEDGKQFSKDYQPAEKWTEKRALELGQELLTWMKAKDEDGEDKGNIFFEDFLMIENDYYDDLTDYLKNKFTSFSALLDSAKRIQEIKLKKFGVGDRLNATMTKFVLTNNHGYSERQDLTNNSGTFEQPQIQVSLNKKDLNLSTE